MTVYRNSRGTLLAGLSAIGFRNPVILGDCGYGNAEFPELHAGWGASTTLNRRTISAGWQKYLVLSKKKSPLDVNMSIIASRRPAL